MHGWFARWRWALVFATQIIFYGLPWLTWNGRQAVLFDLAARKFYIFGLVFWPQDVIYLTVLLIIAALSLFLFTAVAGRLWCGYACPQTVYTEIFLWIERRIEGDRAGAHPPRRARRCRSRSSAIKALKHASWIALALWTGIHVRRLLHADPRPRHPRAHLAARAVGERSGCSSTASRPTATPAACASRSASTCARTRASRA